MARADRISRLIDKWSHRAQQARSIERQFREWGNHHCAEIYRVASQSCGWTLTEIHVLCSISSMDQDDKCFACGRPFRQNSYGRIVFHPEALTLDGQRVFVGYDCAKKINSAGADGYQPPRGGPRLWVDMHAPAEALAAAGIVIRVLNSE
jgi:hypothetical protein